ncbi:MAG: dihydropteroate synthase [Coriobacteriales bacterium]|jgi:5-methyltetrahydrofolate--homocysteine methyltransferase|nr:dihydropteroate synthase [Coriobacteriales bacterium]
MEDMIIIGEKINGFIPKTLRAIEERDLQYIRELAEAQEENGADYLDICAGVGSEKELEVMSWLIDAAQESSSLPLCLDSSSPKILLETMKLANRPGIINSVSLEVEDGKSKCDLIFPVIAASDWKVIALTIDANGIPEEPEGKAEVARRMITQAAEAGIVQNRILIDLVVTTLATKQDSLSNFTDSLRLVHAEFPEVHFTSGLSNISFGMPFRKAINMQFLALAMAAGMDSAIMDPLSPDMQATLHATSALLGRDEYCMEYLQAYRDGLFGAK